MSSQESGKQDAPHTKNIHRLDRFGLNKGRVDMYIRTITSIHMCMYDLDTFMFLVGISRIVRFLFERGN